MKQKMWAVVRDDGYLKHCVPNHAKQVAKDIAEDLENHSHEIQEYNTYTVKPCTVEIDDE